MIGDAWARQCGRQQSQALCEVVVTDFWRELAKAGARRGEWLLLDGLRLDTGIVGSGPLSCALSIGDVGISPYYESHPGLTMLPCVYRPLMLPS